MLISNNGEIFKVDETTSIVLKCVKETNDFNEEKPLELTLPQNCDFKAYCEYIINGAIDNINGAIATTDFLNDEVVFNKILDIVFTTNLFDYYTLAKQYPHISIPKKTSDDIWASLLPKVGNLNPDIWYLLPESFKKQKNHHELIMGKILGTVVEEWRIGTKYVFGNGDNIPSKDQMAIENLFESTQDQPIIKDKVNIKFIEKMKVAKIKCDGFPEMYILIPKDFNGKHIITLTSNIVHDLTVVKCGGWVKYIDGTSDLYDWDDFGYYSKHAKIYLSKITGLIGDEKGDYSE